MGGRVGRRVGGREENGGGVRKQTCNLDVTAYCTDSSISPTIIMYVVLPGFQERI